MLTLVVMAAGMGSRYGGLKQIDPVGPNGELIIDYSIFDAKQAGFDRLVFVIKPEIETAFKQMIGNRMAAILPVDYAMQELCDLPAGFTPPPDREKPWGTAHALRSARKVVQENFAVINADDYYGREAFQKMAAFLQTAGEGQYAMVGYSLVNTMTEHGHVARGVCTVQNGKLTDIRERTRIAFQDGYPAFCEEGERWTPLPEHSTVSMNLWGFTPGFFAVLEEHFPRFLAGELPNNPQKAEYFLPLAVDAQLKAGQATVEVLTSADRWYGVTYREDKPVVQAAIRRLIDQGVYAEKLWC